MPGDLCTALRIISLLPLSLETDVTDATLGVSSLWLGTRTGPGGTATLLSYFGRNPWLHGQQVCEDSLLIVTKTCLRVLLKLIDYNENMK